MLGRSEAQLNRRSPSGIGRQFAAQRGRRVVPRRDRLRPGDSFLRNRDSVQAVGESGCARCFGGDAQAGIAIPHDFPRNLARGTTATIQVIVDASDPLSSQAALAAAAGVAQVRNLAILSAAANRTELPIETRVRPRYNPGLRSPNYIVPGLVGVILTITMVLVTAMAIVRERERGTLEQLIVTPITKTELMLGKITPYIGVGLVQMTTVLLVGRVVFDVPLTGNLLLLYAVALIFVIASLSLGLFISTLVRTQQQSMQVSFFIVLPNILLSGFMFPRAAMPLFFQPLMGLTIPPVPWVIVR